MRSPAFLHLAAAAAAFCIATAGCVNTSTLQTARTLDPGKQRILVGGGYYASPSVDADASEATGSDVDLKFPYMEVGYRRGIIPKLEVGAKVTIPGTVGVDGKYRLLEKGDLAFAAGLGVAYLSLSSGTEDAESSTTLIDVTVPAYASYDVADAFALYVSPKYVVRMAQSVDAMEEDTSALGQLVGATTGIRLGKRLGVFLEASYLKDLTSDFDSFQVNSSIFF